jgi:hypothetical protein
MQPVGDGLGLSKQARFEAELEQVFGTLQVRSTD